MTIIGHNSDDDDCKSDIDHGSGIVRVGVSDTGGKDEMRSEMDRNRSADISSAASFSSSSSSCSSGERNNQETFNDMRMDTDDNKEDEEEFLDENSGIDNQGGLQPPQPPDFQPGDHVYQWCSLFGIPAVFAHHGIVLDVAFHEETQKWSLLIVDFDNWHDDDDNDDDDDDRDDDRDSDRDNDDDDNDDDD